MTLAMGTTFQNADPFLYCKEGFYSILIIVFTFPKISVTFSGTPKALLKALSPERYRCQERRRRDQGRIQRVEEEIRE